MRRILIVCSLVGFSIFPQVVAAQTCGVVPQNIGKLFASGFEFGETRPTLPVENQPLSLTVSAPADGITIGQESIQIVGTFTGPPNTGVAVNEAAAAVFIPNTATGTQSFLANIDLDSGSNTISVVLTSESGVIQTITRTITFDAATAPLAVLNAAFTSDFAAMKMGFRVQPKPGKTVQSIAIDYTSDGAVDQSGDGATKFVGTYPNAGIYLATAQITVTDPGGANPQAVTATRLVIAENKQVLRYTLCRVYERVRTDLQAQQIASALSYLSSDIRPRFQTLWTAILPQLPTIAPQLGEIVSGVIGSDVAAFTLHKPDGPNRVRAFSVQFSKSASGVWRISNW